MATAKSHSAATLCMGCLVISLSLGCGGTTTTRAARADASDGSADAATTEDSGGDGRGDVAGAEGSTGSGSGGGVDVGAAGEAAPDLPIGMEDGAGGGDGADVSDAAAEIWPDAPDPGDAPADGGLAGDVRGLDVAAVDGDGREAGAAEADYLIIAADPLAASARRYRDFRVASGFRVELAMVSEVVGDAATATDAVARIVAYVRARYQPRPAGRPLYLLLLGDAQAEWPGDGSGVPSGVWLDATTGAPVVSDNVFADMDGDDIPDLAVGRITGDSDADVDLVRGKVADHERGHAPGEWDRRINVFASTSGLGLLADIAIETLAYDTIEAVPYDYGVTMTYANQSSPYVYVPEQFSAQVYRRINEGALLVAYLGHGKTDGFAQLDWNGVGHPILDTQQLDTLLVTHRSPVLLFVACSTGAFAGRECVSERILAQANAPTAILSATEVSHPYASAIFTHELMQLFAAARVPTLGEAFLRAKQRMPAGTDSVRETIEALAALLITAAEKQALKLSHLHMFTLFGDPAMRIGYPGRAEVQVMPASASAGDVLTVTVGELVLGGAGEAIVTLESARKTILGPIAPVPPDGDPGRDAVIVQNYETANDKVVASVTVVATGPSVSVTLPIPPGLPAGDYHVKAFVRDDTAAYVGSAVLTVR